MKQACARMSLAMENLSAKSPVFPVAVVHETRTRRHGEQRLKALIIDDAREAIDLMVSSLAKRWPNIGLIATDSGVEAVQLARAIAPDILLLDLELVDVYGLQVLKEIRSFSSLPVIIITANSDETVRFKCV